MSLLIKTTSTLSGEGRGRWLWRRGSAVLDAALVFPILLSLTFGTVEYGHYFYWKHTLQGAAREGAAPRSRRPRSIPTSPAP